MTIAVLYVAWALAHESLYWQWSAWAKAHGTFTRRYVSGTY